MFSMNTAAMKGLNSAKGGGALDGAAKPVGSPLSYLPQNQQQTPDSGGAPAPGAPMAPPGLGSSYQPDGDYQMPGFGGGGGGAGTGGGQPQLNAPAEINLGAPADSHAQENWMISGPSMLNPYLGRRVLPQALQGLQASY